MNYLLPLDKGFNPLLPLDKMAVNQPRVPAGSPEGGQFGPGGGSEGSGVGGGYERTIRSSFAGSDYVYHGTSAANAAPIRAGGLKPSENPLNFHASIDSSEYYAGKGGALFRVRVSDLPKATTFDGLTHRAWTSVSVPTRVIEERRGGVWAPIKKITKSAPRTLYVKRRLLNAGAVRAWAASQGIASALPAGDMHVTVAFSREPVDWSALTPMQDAIVVLDDGVEKMNPNHDERGRFASGPGGGGGLLMDRTSRLARASEQGFDTSTVWYHGTTATFSQFKTPPGDLNDGIFITTKPSKASDYAGGDAPPAYPKDGAAPQVHALYIRGKIASYEQYAAVYAQAGGDWKKARKLLADRGFVGQAGLGGNARVWLPKNIRSVNAAFDPKYKDSAELLKSEDASIQKARAVHQFPPRSTPNGALVLKFESPELSARWQEFRDAGASWDFPEYQPHITITYSVAAADVGKIEPYRGPLIFGPEEFAEVDEGWAGEVEEEPLVKAFNPDQPRDDQGQWSGGGGEVTTRALGSLDGLSVTVTSGRQVDHYRRQIQSGKSLKPIQLTRLPDGSVSLQDGHHRLAAARAEGLGRVPVQILDLEWRGGQPRVKKSVPRIRSRRVV